MDTDCTQHTTASTAAATISSTTHCTPHTCVSLQRAFITNSVCSKPPKANCSAVILTRNPWTLPCLHNSRLSRGYLTTLPLKNIAWKDRVTDMAAVMVSPKYFSGRDRDTENDHKIPRLFAVLADSNQDLPLPSCSAGKKLYCDVQLQAYSNSQAQRTSPWLKLAAICSQTVTVARTCYSLQPASHRGYNLLQYATSHRGYNLLQSAASHRG